jgi:hypothetical protein
VAGGESRGAGIEVPSVREKLTGVNVSGLYFMAADVGTASEGKQWQGRREESKGGSGGSGGSGLRRRWRAAALNRNRNRTGTGTNGNRVYATLTVLQTPVYAVQTRRSRLGTRRAAQWSRQWREVSGVTAGRGAACLCSRGRDGGVAVTVARREKNQCSAVQCGAGRQQTWTADMDSRQQTRLLSSLSSLLVGGARQGYRHEPRAWPPANWGSRAESGTAPDSPPLPATDCPP